jgi:hypothetical protein
MAFSKKRLAAGASRLAVNRKVDRLALLVDCTIQILPGAFDLIYVSSILQLLLTACLWFRTGFSKQWQKPHRPTVDRGMVNRHAAFLHDFFKVPIAQGYAAYQRMQTRITLTGNRIPLVFSMATYSFVKGNSLPDSGGRLP